MKIIKKYKNIQKRLTLFDYILIIFFLTGLIFFAYIFFRRPSYIDVTVKVSEDGLIWPKPGSENWFARFFYTGMKERSSLEGTQAEVINVFSVASTPNTKAIYLTVKLRSVYTKANKQFSFKGKPVLVGYPINLQLDNVNVDGLITQVGDTKNQGDVASFLIEAEAWGDNKTFNDTTGIHPYIAESIKVGDSVTDNTGNPIITIIDKNVTDARKLVTTANGEVIVKKNPLLKDLHLVLKIKATKYNDGYYLFDDVPILIGGTIPINLPYLSIYPEISKITPLKE